MTSALPSTSANLVRILLQQQEAIEQHQRNLANAADLDTAVANQSKEAASSLTALSKSLTDLKAAISVPAMPALASALGTISGWVSSLSQQAEKHPTTAMAIGGGASAIALGGAGWMSYQIARGFGLPSAATELTAAARALDGAAGKMGAGGPRLDAPGGGGYASLIMRTLSATLLTYDLVRDMPAQIKRDAAGKPYIEQPEFVTAINKWGKDNFPSFFRSDDRPSPAPEPLPKGQWRRPNRHGGDPEPDAASTAAPQVDTSQLDATKAKGDDAKATLDMLNGTFSPKIDLVGLDQLIAKITQARAGLAALSAGGGFHPSSGALHDGPEGR